MKLNYKKVICVGFAFFLISMFWQVYDTVISKILIDAFGLNQTWSGVVMALDNIIAVILLPVFGKLSDDTNTKWGKRTPYIVIGTVLAAALIVIIGIIDKCQINHLAGANIQPIITHEVQTIPVEEVRDFGTGAFDPNNFKEIILSEAGTKYYEYQNILYLTKDAANEIRSVDVMAVTKSNIMTFVAFIGVLFFVLLAMASFRTPAVSLMPDVTVKPLRSKANAIINLMGSAGGILALGYLTFLAHDYKSYIVVFIVLAVLMIAALGVFLITVNERKLVETMHKEAIEYGIETADEVKEQTEKVKTKMPKDVKKSFLLILTSIIFWFMAYNAATSKFSVYATTVLDFKNFSMPLMVAQGAAIISYLPIGMLSTKLGRKKTILLGIIELFLAFLLASFATDRSAFLLYGIMALAGIGWATINVNSYPMVVEMAKGSDVGKYTGIYYTASMTAQIITPILSGLLMDVINMRVLFPYSAIFCVLAFTTMIFVRHGDSKKIPENKSKKEVFEDTINALDD